MKKEYIVDLTEEEADDLMDEHWVGELIRCKDCKWGEPGECGCGIDCDGCWHDDDWFCADGERR